VHTPLTPAERLLVQARAQITIALEALEDEHEGNFTRAVYLLGEDVDRLRELVADW
jgi:hypothetical protein